MNYYALYKGDEFIMLGTAEELAKYENVKKETIIIMCSPSYRKKLKDKDNAKIVIKIEDDD